MPHVWKASVNDVTMRRCRFTTETEMRSWQNRLNLSTGFLIDFSRSFWRQPRIKTVEDHSFCCNHHKNVGVIRNLLDIHCVCGAIFVTESIVSWKQIETNCLLPFSRALSDPRQWRYWCFIWSTFGGVDHAPSVSLPACRVRVYSRRCVCVTSFER